MTGDPSESDTGTESSPEPHATITRIGRWRSALVVALVSSCLAVALGVPALLLLSVVALGFVLVGYASGPSTGEITLERSLSDDRPRPGQSVTVSLSVTNEGEGVISDVRIVDEPPDDVAVTDGEPAFATAIRPGETVTSEYELTPPRGEFTFGETTVRRRNVPVTVLTTETHEADGETAFTCETLLDTFPFRDQTIQYVGRTPTDDGGSGIEFYATREYRRGDPINRIDWHKLARTGELATVEYREERAVTIVFLIDDRSGVHRRAPGGGPDSFDLSLYAAARGVVASLDDGNRTGFTLLSDDVWIDPGSGTDVQSRIEDAISDTDGESDHGRDSGTTSSRERTPSNRIATDGSGPGQARSRAHQLAHRLPSDAQVVFCTPLSDSYAVDLVRQLRTMGRAVTLVSPDMTTGVSTGSSSRAPAESTTDATDTGLGARIAALERANRLDECRGLGAAVVDWDLGDPISIDLARVLTGGRSR